MQYIPTIPDNHSVFKRWNETFQANCCHQNAVVINSLVVIGTEPIKKANFLKSWGLPEAWIPEETQLCKLV